MLVEESVCCFPSVRMAPYTSVERIMKQSSKNVLDEATRIFDEWYRRHRSQVTSPPYVTAHSYLKRAVYELVQAPALSRNQYLTLKRLVQKERGEVPKAPPIEENPFFWGFLLVFGDDSCLTRGDRSKFSTELLYARMHDVPAELLIGFIYQAGGYARISQQMKRGETEDWLKEGKQTLVKGL